MFVLFCMRVDGNLTEWAKVTVAENQGLPRKTLGGWELSFHEFLSHRMQRNIRLAREKKYNKRSIAGITKTTTTTTTTTTNFICMTINTYSVAKLAFIN